MLNTVALVALTGCAYIAVSQMPKGRLQLLMAVLLAGLAVLVFVGNQPCGR